MVEEVKLYKCSVCGLHYESEALAGECEEWCSSHNSCNFDIARQHYKIPEEDRRISD